MTPPRLESSCRSPIFLPEVLPNPEFVRRLVEDNGPYLPVQRYFSNQAEFDAASGSSDGKPMIIAPNFRGDWAYESPLIDGVAPILEHAGFADAASRLFDRATVHPFSVYSNITWQLPFDQGGGHTDVPEFRGISRSDYPTWLLAAMGYSRLFEEHRVEIATVVAWFYEGKDGGFTYWPDGADAPPLVHEGAIFNTAIAGDNDRMFHRVRPVGRPEDGMLTNMSLDTELVHIAGDDWEIRDGGSVLGRLRYAELRVSVSWKARVFTNSESERLYRDHSDDLSLDEVFGRFSDDLAARGLPSALSDDPVHDPELVRRLDRAYGMAPTIFDRTAA